jgi:PIN domain nuclease of toxin-antitoxin system
MRLLLDSHVFLWWLQDNRRLGRAAHRSIEAPTSSVFVSAASIWELAIKIGMGKLRFRRPADTTLDAAIGACGFAELPVTARHAIGVRDLPLHHGDPFDRLLAAQALAEQLRLVTADDVFERYGVAVIAAAR